MAERRIRQGEQADIATALHEARTNCCKRSRKGEGKEDKARSQVAGIKCEEARGKSTRRKLYSYVIMLLTQ